MSVSNVIKNEGVISIKQSQTSVMVNGRFEEQAENQYVAGLNIRRVPFGGYRLIE